MHRNASPERERAAAQSAVEAAGAVSPRFEEAAPGLVYLDAAGLSKLFGDDRAVARALVAAAERVGLRAAVGVAAGKSLALLAARARPQAKTFTIVFYGATIVCCKTAQLSETWRELVCL